jgi:hypothetical protein
LFFSEYGLKKAKRAFFFRTNNSIISSLPIEREPEVFVDNYYDLLFIGNISEFKSPKGICDTLLSNKSNISIAVVSSAKFDHDYNNLTVICQNLMDEDIASYILKSRIVIIPHLHLTQSGVFYRAIALSRPVIANKCDAWEVNSDVPFPGVVLDFSDYFKLVEAHKIIHKDYAIFQRYALELREKKINLFEKNI